MQLFLFISGKAFSGKDTFYDMMKNRFKGVEQSSFAMEVKKEFCRLNPQIELQQLLTDPIIKAKCRGELIEIGDGYRQKFGDNIWIEKHLDGLERDGVFERKQIINCVTDTRYYNENHDYPQLIMKKHKHAICLRIRVHCGLQTRLERMGNTGAINYIKYGLFSRSECELDDYKCDINIHNGVNFYEDDGSLNKYRLSQHYKTQIRSELDSLLINVFKYQYLNADIV